MPVHGRTGAIVGVRHDPLPARRIPLEFGRRGPHGITNILRGKLPRHRAGSTRACRTALEFFGGDETNDGIRLCRDGVARDLRRRQHFLGILQCARGRDDVSRRYRDRERVVAVVEVEFALAQIRLDVPAAHVVVDRDTRIPLRDFEQCAIATHAVRAMLGNQKRPRCLDRRRLSRRQRLGEVDLQQRFVVTTLECRAPCRLSRGRSAQQLVEAREVVSARKATCTKSRLFRKDERVERVGLERVLLRLQPEEAQRVR